MFGEDKIDKEGIAKEFSGVISERSIGRGLLIQLKNGIDLRPYNLDSGMDSVSVGDSISKKKNEDSCTIYKKDGRVLKVKFIYMQLN